jgi:preprotein translocase subunit SecF
MQLIKANTKLDFLGKRNLAFGLSIILMILTVISLFTRGLNFGIDFTGGILIEAEFKEAPDLAKMRASLKDAGIGEVSLQTFGKPTNVMIRIGQEAAQESARVKIVDIVKTNIIQNIGKNVEYRRVDYVGPKVGEELIKGGIVALLLSFASIMCYIWFRFEWQYGIGGIVALIHDAWLTIGFFSLTQLDFDLSSVAAILTIIGYSINDSVVIYDRIRENLRKYKKMPIAELLNLSINETLSRTILTVSTVLVAVLTLILVGGEVIKSFSLSTFFGIAIGTYSSIYISAPILIYLNLRPETETVKK